MLPDPEVIDRGGQRHQIRWHCGVLFHKPPHDAHRFLVSHLTLVAAIELVKAETEMAEGAGEVESIPPWVVSGHVA